MRHKHSSKSHPIHEKLHLREKPKKDGDRRRSPITPTRTISQFTTRRAESEIKKKDHLHRKHFFLIIILSIALYANSLNGDFVHDDLFVIVRNKDVVSAEKAINFLWNDFWGKPLQDTRSHKSYRPVTILSFRLNYLLHGLNSLSFHVINVSLHCAVSILFTKVCQHFIFTEESSSRDNALIAGLLFAAHPIHTEAVSGIVGRADVLAGLFFLLSFYLYARNVPRPCSKQSIFSAVFGSIILAACAMFSKEQGVTVLSVNVGYDVLFTVYELTRDNKFKLKNVYAQPHFRSMVKRLSIVTAAAVCLISLRIVIMGGALPSFLEEDNPASFSDSFLTRFLTYSFLISFNCWLLLCPKSLSYDWQVGSIPLVESVWDCRNLATAAVFSSLAFLVFKVLFLSTKGAKPVVLGLMFLVIPFLPASNIFLTVGFVVAERILYIPSMGFCILVAFGIANLKQTFPARKPYMLQTAVVCTVAVFAARTIQRNEDWSSRESLFSAEKGPNPDGRLPENLLSGLKVLPHNAKMHYNWANYLQDINSTDSAIHHYREAIRLYPDHASAHNNLGNLVTDIREKEYHLKQALCIDSYHVNAHVNLAMLRSDQGNQSLALFHLNQAVAIDPDSYEAVSNLASILTGQGEFQEAEKFHKRAMLLQPRNADVVNNYGVFLLTTDRLAEAMFYFEKTLALQPKHVTAMINLGLLHKRQGQIAEAEKWYLQAVSTERTHTTLKGMAGFYFSVENWIQAKDIYQELFSSGHVDLDSVLHYGQIVINLDVQSECEAFFDGAVLSFPNDLELRRILASIKSSLKKYDEATSHLEKGIQISQFSSLPASIEAKVRFEYANNLKSLGRYNEASKEYSLATTIDPSMSSAFLNLGALHHLKGEYEAAKVNYFKALQLDPENMVLKENLVKLERLMRKRRKNSVYAVQNDN